MRGEYRGMNGKKLTVVSVRGDRIVPESGDYAMTSYLLKWHIHHFLGFKKLFFKIVGELEKLVGSVQFP